MKLTITVHPNSKQQKVIDQNNELHVYVRARAKEGEANKAVIEVLAQHFQVKKSAVLLLRGEKGKKKVVEVVLGDRP